MLSLTLGAIFMARDATTISVATPKVSDLFHLLGDVGSMERPALPIGDLQLPPSLVFFQVDIRIAPKPEVKSIEHGPQTPSLFPQDSRDLVYCFRLKKSSNAIGTTPLAECTTKS